MPGMTPDAGAERSLLALAPGLLEAGIELHLALLTKRQTLVPELEELGVVIHDLSSARRLRSRVRALRRTVAAVSPGLVHATLFEASQVAQLASMTAARSKRVPLLVTWASTVYAPGASQGVRWGKAKYGTLRWWEIVLARATHARYHAVTRGVAEYNGPRLRVGPDRIRVGERGRDGPALRAAAEDPDRVRTEVDVGPGGRLILTVGRQDNQKAHDALVRTFDRYAAAHPGDRLVIAGRSGTGTSALNQALQTMEHPDSVVVLGHRDDVPTLLAAADAVVCSSLREGAAGVLVEAMAVGTPVVSVPLDGLRGVLVDGQNARVAQLAKFPETLEELFADPDATRRMTTAAQQEADERFSVERSADRLADIYRWAADAT
jgi:glycosyltransferase involved in cell wall biosynthesis